VTKDVTLEMVLKARDIDHHVIAMIKAAVDERVKTTAYEPPGMSFERMVRKWTLSDAIPTVRDEIRNIDARIEHAIKFEGLPVYERGDHVDEAGLHFLGIQKRFQFLLMHLDPDTKNALIKDVVQPVPK
jgi:hypothetical protein